MSDVVSDRGTPSGVCSEDAQRPNRSREVREKNTLKVKEISQGSVPKKWLAIKLAGAASEFPLWGRPKGKREP